MNRSTPNDHQVHQIQSGQVIVDLRSVVKELVENALDASATSIEVRFKNNGLDSVEVADNGNGIAPEDFDSLALKHYTSKLARYDDLTRLTTFGFRGEALSSLCALSRLHVTTSRAEDAPKGTKIAFETSGKVKSQTVVASQKGTTVTVEDIFQMLPVRRRELEKNIKRDFGKVLSLLHAYACISVGVRFSVSNTPTKGKKVVAFTTKSNPTTRENISNVYGAKTLAALLPLNLTLALHPTTASTTASTLSIKMQSTQTGADEKKVRLTGHISRPVVGEGRQTPDRQMFFVNNRPCALPQVSKAINDVYKSYNVTQSPFVFANLELDTNAYDVNVSPDKRTILLHDQTALLEALKESLTELFEKHDQSVPTAATPSIRRLPSFKPLTAAKPPTSPADANQDDSEEETSSQSDDGAIRPSSILRRAVEGEDIKIRKSATQTAMAALAEKRRRESANAASEAANMQGDNSLAKEQDDSASGQIAQWQSNDPKGHSLVVEEVQDETAGTATHDLAEPRDTLPATSGSTEKVEQQLPRAIKDFNARMGVTLPARRQDARHINYEDDSEGDSEDEAAMNHRFSMERSDHDRPAGTPEEKIPSVANTPQKTTLGVVPNAFDRMRPKRTSQDVATITIGNQTTRMVLGTPEAKKRRIHTPKLAANVKQSPQDMPGFVSTLKAFAAPGTADAIDDEDEEMDTYATISAPASFVKPSFKGHSTARAHPPSSSSMNATVTTLSSDQLDLEDQPAESGPDSAIFLASEDDQDDDYMDESDKKAREEAKIAKLIELAEERAARPSSENMKRANSAMKSRSRKDSTLQLMQTLDTSIDRIECGLKRLTQSLDKFAADKMNDSSKDREDSTSKSAEERLSLTVSKSDFSRMRIIGQFNLGFILATRTTTTSDLQNAQDELFIIDQHASDEKYNFERLQSQTIVQNQRLVHHKQLDLTAIEEEIILNHKAALEKNGFEITVDTSGVSPVGQRCKLTSLPMSHEVTFSLSDLEELLALLSEHPGSTNHVPRPSKVRKMFAMRACRSSIMVGKTLTIRQMEKVVRHMGELDKPWNCPHGRPTMRHLYSMNSWEGWAEDEEDDAAVRESELEYGSSTNWSAYVAKGRELGLLDTDERETKIPER